MSILQKRWGAEEKGLKIQKSIKGVEKKNVTEREEDEERKRGEEK